MHAPTLPLIRRPAMLAALLVAAAGTGTILGALFFQYVVGLAPCPLCLEQRLFYYAAIPLALVTALAAWCEAPRWLIATGLAIVALIMLGGAALALYHAGVEWKWWQGPQDCSGPLNPLGSRGLLDQLQDIRIVRCDEAPWRFLGLSLAGYNVLISLALALVAASGIWAMRQPSRV